MLCPGARSARDWAAVCGPGDHWQCGAAPPLQPLPVPGTLPHVTTRDTAGILQGCPDCRDTGISRLQPLPVPGTLPHVTTRDTAGILGYPDSYVPYYRLCECCGYAKTISNVILPGDPIGIPTPALQWSLFEARVNSAIICITILKF